MCAATSETEAWSIEKGTQMTSFTYPMDLHYELQGRYPGNAAFNPSKGVRSALQINLDVWRTRRAEALGR